MGRRHERRAAQAAENTELLELLAAAARRITALEGSLQVARTQVETLSTRHRSLMVEADQLRDVRKQLDARCEELRASVEALLAELAPGCHPAAERRAKNLLRRTRMASDMPPAPVREPGLVEEVTAP